MKLSPSPEIDNEEVAVLFRLLLATTRGGSGVSFHRGATELSIHIGDAGAASWVAWYAVVVVVEVRAGGNVGVVLIVLVASGGIMVPFVVVIVV